ncbi:MAG: transposase [Gemmatimonadetes bacterium]|nr:transposase [Gemmatimonadota bacterium]
MYDDRFAREYGPWRSVVAQVAEKFLACGILDHGFARIRCTACAHEYLLAFSCKCRYFCPSCHAKRLAIWTQWLDTTLLAPVPHRQVVLTIPKRLRAYCLYRRRLLGEIARVAARTVTAAIRTLTGERDLAVGIVACLQTHGSRANWHPHLHLLVTDGGFRPDGTFVSWPAHDAARLTEAFRRAVLRLFVRLALFDEEQAAGMLTWPHSGFHVHTAVWVPEDDRAFATRLARYCARNPVALERLTYDRAAHAVTYRSDKSEGPTAGTETVDPLEFLARVLVHIPDKGQVTTRYYGWYANRPQGMRLKATPGAAGPPAIVPRAPPGADRGGPPMGAAPAADLRGRPTRVSHLPRRDARRGVHYAVVGHRPDPHPPPHPRRARAPPRRPEPAIDAGPCEPEPRARPRPVADAPPPG